MMKEEVDWDDVYFRNYTSKAFWDHHWICKANELITSARKLEPEVTNLWESVEKHFENKEEQLLPDLYTGSYFMLISYAIENLFKAEIIRKNRFKFENNFKRNRKFPRQLKSHDLVKLAEDAGFSISPKDEDLLRRLTRSATWYGRYPVPLNYKHSAGAEMFSSGENYSVSWFGINDVKNINKLLSKINNHLNI